MNRLAARLGAVLLGTVAAVTVAGTPAQAAPTIAQPSCESGGNRFICFTQVSGGTGTVQIRWTYNGSPVSSWNDRTLVSSGCSGGSIYQIGVTATDATGSSSSSGVLVCRRGDWT